MISAAIIDLWLLRETSTVSPGFAVARSTAWLLRLDPFVENRQRFAPQARAARVGLVDHLLALGAVVDAVLDGGVGVEGIAAEEAVDVGRRALAPLCPG